MLKRLVLVALMWACVSTTAEGRERFFSYCQRGGQKVVTQGLQSAGLYQRTFQSCTLHVYFSGTTTLVPPGSLFSDNLAPTSTPLANPFTSASDGFFFFYAPAGRYDVQETFVDHTVTPAVTIQLTWSDISLCDALGPNADTACTSAPPSAFSHNLLSPTHLDTVPYTPPEIGDLARGNLYQMWERLGVAQVGEVLTLIDAGGNPMPEWVWPSTLDTCTSVQVNGVEAGCEHEINLIPGTNISSITVVDNSSAGSNDVTINAAGGGAAITCDPNKLVTVYVDPAGSDTIGDGTIGNPWLTIQHAWNVGVPDVVDGTYIIQLKSPGVYPPPAGDATYLSNKSFFGYSFNETNCSGISPCSLVKIQGDIAASETYILDGNSCCLLDQGVINVTGVPVTMEGFVIKNANFGLAVQSGGKVTIGAVTFLNNNVGLELEHDGGVYLEQSTEVNNCTDAWPNCDTIRFYNDVTHIPSTGLTFSTEAIEINGGYLNDVCGSFAYNTGVQISIYNNPGFATFGQGIFAQNASNVTLSSSVYIDGATGIGSGGVSNSGSHIAMNDLQIDGAYTGIFSSGGYVSAAPFLINSSFSVKNATVGVYLNGQGEVVDIPNFNTVTTSVSGNSGLYEYFDSSRQMVQVTYSQLAGLAHDGAHYKCTDCDTPASPGAACSNAGPASEAIAQYVRSGWKCF